MAKKPIDIRRIRKALGEHIGNYHRALGAFVTAFSRVEATLLKVLWILARLEAPYAQAVLSGVKIEGAMGLINRIAEAEQWPDNKKAEWQEVFTQLGLINKLRNDILHYGGSMLVMCGSYRSSCGASPQARSRSSHYAQDFRGRDGGPRLDDYLPKFSAVEGGTVYGGRRRSWLLMKSSKAVTAAIICGVTSGAPASK